VISLGTAVTTLIAGLGAAVITSHDDTNRQKDNIAAQARGTDKAELLEVIGQAERSVLRTQAALAAIGPPDHPRSRWM
jgi:hypothetical protein